MPAHGGAVRRHPPEAKRRRSQRTPVAERLNFPPRSTEEVQGIKGSRTMATSQRDERRLLSDEEYALVEQTRYPALGKLEENAIKDLTQRLRERRDRARDIANQQRRDVRGKGRAATSFDKKDAGNRQKAGVLAEALTRISNERSRRKSDELRQNARRALSLKQGAVTSARPPSGKTSAKGHEAQRAHETRQDRQPDGCGPAFRKRAKPLRPSATRSEGLAGATQTGAQRKPIPCPPAHRRPPRRCPARASAAPERAAFRFRS